MDERKELLGIEATAFVGKDYWWPDATAESLDGLSAVVRLTLPRFLEAAPYRELDRSTDWNDRRKQLLAIAVAVEPLVGRPSIVDLDPTRVAPWHDAAVRLGFATTKSDAAALGEDAALSRAVGILD